MVVDRGTGVGVADARGFVGFVVKVGGASQLLVQPLSRSSR